MNHLKWIIIHAVQILLNHVVLGDLTSAAVLEAIEASADGTVTVESLRGELDVTTDGGDITITPAGSSVTAKVVVADVETCVGTVHVIDMVLVPSVVISEDGAAATVAVADAPMSAGEELAASEGAFDTMMAPMAADAPISGDVRTPPPSPLV